MPNNVDILREVFRAVEARDLEAVLRTQGSIEAVRGRCGENCRIIRKESITSPSSSSFHDVPS